MAITTCVHVWVKPDNLKDFIEASIKNQQHSRKEKGNLRFDVCQDPANPCKFLLYESYVDDLSAAAHKETLHYQEWRDRVAPFMEQPRKGDRYNVLAY